MRTYQYQRGELGVGGLRLARLAEQFGTPLYVYDFDAVQANYSAYRQAFAGTPHLVCAAVKANGALALLQRLADWGSGFDVVSGGELDRVLTAGGRADRTVFSGVGKTAAEMDAALRAGILLFNVESEAELDLLAQRAGRLRRRARYGLRVNPDIAAVTHPHIATGLREHKFGIALPLARRLYRRFQSHWLEPSGISFHIGSQILETGPFAAATQRVARFAAGLERGGGLRLAHFDVGGGLGIAYQPGQPPPPSVADYAAAIGGAVRKAGWGGDRNLIVEPGRSLVAAAGVLLTRVLYVKENAGKRFVIVDAGANDLLRPSLYNAYHEIVPVRTRAGRRRRVDVVGPICESGDSFARARLLAPVQAGDVLAILDAGAYGYALSSNYNGRPRAAEVAVEAGKARLIRRRETLEDLKAADLLTRS